MIGGFPEAVRRTPRRRSAFFDSYLTTLIERDVLEVANIERRGESVEATRPARRRAGQLLVPGNLAGQSGIPRTTLVRYLELLASVFLIKSIPAWSSNLTQRAVGHPKLAFVDTGVACHVIGQDAARLGEPGGAAGSMMENFVVMELARQLTWSEERGTLFHYRTKDGVEVDAVIETPDGRVIGIEVKAGATVRTADLAGPAQPGRCPWRPIRRWIRSVYRAADTTVRRQDPSPSTGLALAAHTVSPPVALLRTRRSATSVRRCRSGANAAGEPVGTSGVNSATGGPSRGRSTGRPGPPAAVRHCEGCLGRNARYRDDTPGRRSRAATTWGWSGPGPHPEVADVRPVSRGT